jgi:hypothetical protein
MTCRDGAIIGTESDDHPVRHLRNRDVVRSTRVRDMPFYRTYQVGHWIRRREWQTVAALLRGGSPPRAAPGAPEARVSVALTVYNRATLALEAVGRVAADPCIAEIVVSDDVLEPSEYRPLCALLSELA